MAKIMDLVGNELVIGTTGQFIGYVEPTTQQLLPLKMYNFLLSPIREADATREGAFFVKRLLQGPQDIWNATQEKIISLKKLWSITDCPDSALKYLKWIVGWTSELDYITDELDDVTLRRLIAASSELWKKRGSETTTLDVLSLVTGAKCALWNWFDCRWISDETEFVELRNGNDSWVLPNPGEPDYGEYYSVLRIVDEGNLNKTLVKNIVKFLRAASERIIIAYVDFMDNFLIDDDSSQWEMLYGDFAIVSNGYLSLDASSDNQCAIASSTYSFDWRKYIVYCKIQGADEFGFGIMFYVTDENNNYRLEFNKSGEDDFVLYKTVSSVTSVVASGNVSYPISDSEWYGVRIHIDEGVLKIYLNTQEIINVSIDAALDLGTFGVFANAGTGSSIKLDECELFQLPLVTELVDANS